MSDPASRPDPAESTPPPADGDSPLAVTDPTEHPFAGYDSPEHFDTVTLEMARRLIRRGGSIGDRLGFLAVFFMPLGFFLFATLYFDIPPWHSYIYIIPFLFVISMLEANSWRVRRFRDEMLRRTLCFSCGRPIPEDLILRRTGRCPDCRRAFNLDEYRPTPRTTMREIIGESDKATKRPTHEENTPRLPPPQDSGSPR